MRRETVAAALNALAVFVSPVFLVLLSSLFPTGGSTVRPSDSSLFGDMIRTALLMARLTVPLSVVAAWRTWVHARMWLTKGASGWQGVLEAGFVGFGTVISMRIIGLRFGSVTQGPTLTVPFVIVYGGLAFIAGLIAGVVLRGLALVALRGHRGVLRQ